MRIGRGRDGIHGRDIRTRRSAKGPALLRSLVSLLVAFSLFSPASAQATAEGAGAEERDCAGVNAVISVPAENLDSVVPSPFQAETTPDGDTTLASLVVTAVQCKGVSVNGGEFQPTTFAAFRVMIDDPDKNQFPNDDLLNAYQFWVVSDNLAMVELFESNGGEAVWVPGLEFMLDTVTGEFKFEAPPPTPSPFEMKGELSPLLFGLAKLKSEFWGADFPHGKMRETSDIPVIALGFANGTVEPQAGSDMDKILCGTAGEFRSDNESVRLFFERGSYTVQRLAEETSRPGEPTCDLVTGSG